jgi:hypothetical protein
MLSAKVIIYNRETGEIVEEYENTLIVGRKPYSDRNFVKVFTIFLRDIVDDEMSKGPIRLLLYILDHLEYNSLTFHLIPDEAIPELNIHRTTFYKWLRVLLRRGYIQKVATNVYRLRPYTAIKGQMDKVVDF